ncbi:small RNA 2'-O-methyltransferase [Myripristis murdjan]|uniref:Small RNA 2'-O-methyltransferase n=1 Tax=Myripristis murdjan TaxID=586833 RepID=A0A667XQ61_9TELE|nr:small RNA 2'-O-methyltransferase [Myripristis murdjan]
MDPLFSPPLHKQRHEFVIDFILKNKPRKVVDLGCSECALLKKLKFHHDIELLVGVDIDKTVLKRKMHGLDPLTSDYLVPGFDQLKIELYEGSVTQKDSRLRGFDLATSIELIEHLHLDDVERFSEVVFGYMAPGTVIVSTPNSEFNPLLPGLKGFRHRDHKFEWTRAQFQSWALKVCFQHGYEVQFTGVGWAPPGLQDRVGFCSQIGVFQRRYTRDDVLPRENAQVFSHTLLYSITYPSLHDNNILRRTLVSELLYWSEELKRRWMQGSGEWDEASALYETKGGEDEDCLSEQKTDVEEMEIDGEEMMYPVEFGADGERQQEIYREGRCVCVPLARLWSTCPKVRALSGSICNLRRLLLDEPSVELSWDGSALRLNDQEQIPDEEEDDYNLDDMRCTGIQCSHGALQQEDWEAELL